MFSLAKFLGGKEAPPVSLDPVAGPHWHRSLVTALGDGAVTLLLPGRAALGAELGESEKPT